jgi:hypothetical protein
MKKKRASQQLYVCVCVCVCARLWGVPRRVSHILSAATCHARYIYIHIYIYIL